MRRAIRIAALAGAVAVAAACQVGGDPYTVFAGAPGDDANAPRGAGTVRVTVNGEVVSEGTETFSGETYRQEFRVEPGQTIVVDVTSKDAEPTCDISKDPGPSEEHLEISKSPSRQDGSGTWRTTCTWKRPSG